MKTYPIVACPACGRSASEAIEFGGAALDRCTACGLVHAREMADPEEVYVEGYMTGDSPFGLNAIDPDFQRFLVFCGHQRLHAIERMVGRIGPMLDVGCGTGDFLLAAKERGIESIGVEPVRESADLATARGVEVRNALLQDAGLAEASYRTVTAFHVLEHMADGCDFLRLLARWVEPSGHVVVEVPNWRSMERRRKGADWPGLRPLEHLAHYSPATLQAVFERSGLVDVQVRTLTFQWPDQNLRYALGDLGLRGIYRSKLFQPLTYQRTGDDGTARHPKAPLRWAIRAVGRAYDAAKVGQVIVAAGRRPA